jgi:isochorismate synthase
MAGPAVERKVPTRCARVDTVCRAFDPLRVVADNAFESPIFYIERPDDGLATVSIGAVETIRSFGRDRFTRAKIEMAAITADFDLSGVTSEFGPGALPRWVGGFGFADDCGSEIWKDFAPCLFVLPRTQWIVEAGRTLRVDVEATGDEESLAPRYKSVARTKSGRENGAEGHGSESSDGWLERARAAIAEVEAGRLGKIVLARRESRRLVDDLDVVGVLARLRSTRPSCYTFCFAVGDSVFLGSSPEKLVEIRDRCFEADALAGTSARGEGRERDESRGRALLDSSKDRREHDAVVEGIRSALLPLSSRLVIDENPAVRAYPEGFHLRTSVRGELAAETSPLDVVSVLHPTPAICGVPRERAREMLDRIESDRGWYTGGIGWVAPNGDALFAVGLRAGLLRDGELATWAGAGIVSGSNAERELAEVELKMKALLTVVDDVTGSR